MADLSMPQLIKETGLPEFEIRRLQEWLLNQRLLRDAVRDAKERHPRRCNRLLDGRKEAGLDMWPSFMEVIASAQALLLKSVVEFELDEFWRES